MKRAVMVAAFLLCGVAHGQALPIETTINVLAVQLPPSGAPHGADILDFMGNLASHWPNPNGITVTLVNGGTPIWLDVDIGTGDADSQLQKAMAGLAAQNKRGTADVVIFFSPNLNNACGNAPMRNWGGDGRHQFIPNVNGLDLDGRDLFYAGIVRSLRGCGREVALHEFGHLFGAGHAFTGPNASPLGWYLFNTSHAWWFAVSPPPINTSHKKQSWRRAELAVLSYGSSAITQRTTPTMLPP